jgi:hypothetical protein
MRLFQAIIIASISSLLFTSAAFAKGDTAKTYVSKNAIHITEKGIFIQKGTQFIPIHTLHRDKKGFYYTARPKYMGPDEWRFFPSPYKDDESSDSSDP